MADLADRLKGVQSFAPVYSPWLNGTVERLNADVLRVMRALLLEARLDTRNWPHVLPIVQANLNHVPVASLAGKSPVELFTGLPPATVLSTLLRPKKGRRGPYLQDLDVETVEAAIATMRNSLHEMHKEVTDTKERRRQRQMALTNGKTCNFHEGDFVSWSRVPTSLWSAGSDLSESSRYYRSLLKLSTC
jgi:hypothetical protein